VEPEVEEDATGLVGEAGEDAFYRLDEDSHLEYLDGRLWVRDSASDRHEALFAFLLTLLTAYLDERGGGIVRGSRYPMRLDARWSPEPDLLVVRAEHLDRMRPTRLEGPADLVVEIASPGDPQRDTRMKLPRYRAAGVPEIWRVVPFERVVEVSVLGPAGHATSRHSAGRLTTAAVPGFWLDVSWLWSDPLPSTMTCLRRILGSD
jgi:Uma2 family endonuclease